MKFSKTNNTMLLEGISISTANFSQRFNLFSHDTKTYIIQNFHILNVTWALISEKTRTVKRCWDENLVINLLPFLKIHEKAYLTVNTEYLIRNRLKKVISQFIVGNHVTFWPTDGNNIQHQDYVAYWKCPTFKCKRALTIGYN